MTARIAKQLGTEVKIDRVGFSLFDKLDMQHILIRDQKKDTLLYANSFKLRISDLVFSSSEPIIKYVGLEGAKIYFNRSSEKWNYQFLADYLSSDTSKKQSSNIDIKKLDVTNLHFVENDKWLGGLTELNADNIVANIKSVQGKNIHIDQIVINKPYYLIQLFKGLKPLNDSIEKAAEVKLQNGDLELNVNRLNI